MSLWNEWEVCEGLDDISALSGWLNVLYGMNGRCVKDWMIAVA